jgi:hypothetical protein
MQISQTKEQINALNAFQNHCELEAITLLSCATNRAKAGSSFVEPFEVKPTLSNTASFVQGDRFIVEVSFEYTAWDSSDPRQRLFKIDCAFEVCYRLQDDHEPTEEQKSSFSKGTAVFNCWPYAREFLSDMTARLGHQTPPLPLLRITPQKADSQSSAVTQVAASPAVTVELSPPEIK